MTPNRGAGRSLVWAVAGFSSLYTVAVVFFYCDWLFDVSGADPLFYGIALNGALCVAATVMFVGARQVRWRRGGAAVAGAVAYVVAFAMLLAASLLNEPTCAYLSGAAAGARVGLLMPLWFARAEELAADRYPMVLGMGSFICAVAALGVDALPAQMLVLVCVALVAASIALLYAVPASASNEAMEMAQEGEKRGAGNEEREGAKETSEEASPITSLVVPGLYVLILSFAYGMLDVVAMASPVADASLSGFASQVGGLVAIVAFIVYINRGARRYAVLLNVALAVVATGVLFLPFLPQGYSVTLVVLAHMGWEVALLVIYTLAIGAARGSDASLLGWSAIVFALPRPALLAGSLAAAFLAAEGQFAFTQMVVVAFALLYLIIIGVAVLRNREQRAYQRALRRKDELIRRYREAQRDLQELACEELAAAHGLTKRETELLRLLAQGRDASYVERTLFLSRNTVKSYRKSLYAKLGVHSQQELIDRVNAAMPVD